jgi:20S proteasome subunit beta 5
MTDDYSNPNCPIKIAHGTTTLAFRFKGGIIVATDSRATAGNWIASQTVKKVIGWWRCRTYMWITSTGMMY